MFIMGGIPIGGGQAPCPPPPPPPPGYAYDSGLVLVQEPWTYATKIRSKLYEAGTSFKVLKRIIVFGPAFMLLLISVVL